MEPTEIDEEFVEWMKIAWPSVVAGTRRWMDLREAWVAGWLTLYLSDREEDMQEGLTGCLD